MAAGLPHPHAAARAPLSSTGAGGCRRFVCCSLRRSPRCTHSVRNPRPFCLAQMDPKFLRNQRKAKRKQDALKKSGEIKKTMKWVPKAA